MDAHEARTHFAGARVARLATVDPHGRPRIVPVCFALAGDTIHTAVDDVKEKDTRRLSRLTDIEMRPDVALLADHYEEDWSQLWWVRASGRARLLDATDPEGAAAIEQLAERYPPYRDHPPPGPVIAVDVQRWTGWRA